MSFQNNTERFVYELCRQSFLSLWSYANPRRCSGQKELCDVLVLCEPEIVLFSVKSYELNPLNAPMVSLQRWQRKAVEDSIRQLYGAERGLEQTTHVTRFDGTQGLPLPAILDRRIHRISVSLGGKGLIPIISRDFGRGFVHVFDEEFVYIALKELNTVTDFVHYLAAKENLATESPGLMIEGGEKELLAIYLFNGRQFPKDAFSSRINSGNWESFVQNPAYQRRVDADRISYSWDELLNYLCQKILGGVMEFGNTLSENEQVVRIMAREPRFERRVLSQSLLDFWELARNGQLTARIAPSPSGVVYVFFNPPPHYNRDTRISELGCRCFIARNEFRNHSTIVGIGYNLDRAPQGHATDLCLLSFEEWTPEQAEHAENMKRELGFFSSPQIKNVHFDEYPQK